MDMHLHGRRHQTTTNEPTRTTAMDVCIENCLNCARACEELISHCLFRGGEHASSAHIKVLMDCAEVCTVSANFMTRGSDFHVETCELCASVCAACAIDCARLAHDDEMMARCADICRQCAESCKMMVGTH